MKRLKNLLYITAAVAAITACTPEDSIGEIPATTPSPSPNPVMIKEPDAKPSSDTDPVALNLPDSGYEFRLSAGEEALYEQLKAELTTDVLEGASPLTIAKIFIQCGIDGEWEAEYAMFAPETTTKTKEEYYQLHLADIETFDLSSRKAVADWRFPLMDEGEFILENDNMGRLDFYQIPAEDLEQFTQEELVEYMEDIKLSFYVIKNDKGIWEVMYNPIS